jgi:hypothetical protein
LNLIYPEKLNHDNGWLSGFFDVDGTVTINKTNTQLSISAYQKTSELLLPLVDLYGGYVYIDKVSSQFFKWYVTKREDIIKLLNYFKRNPSRSAKQNRLHLISRFFDLKDLKAHKASADTNLFKTWQYFFFFLNFSKWLKYENKKINYKYRERK